LTPLFFGPASDLLKYEISINATMTARNSATRFLPLFLTFSGLLPFIIGALLPLLGFEALPLIGNVAYAIATYGLVIVMFLTGIHWGQQLSLGRTAPGLFIYSNILAILSWLLLRLQYFLVFLTVPKMLILAIDHSLYMQAVLKKGYIIFRSFIIGIVIICLFLAGSSL
jgi:hypothetical protein